MLIAVVVAFQTPKPAEIWAKVVESYAKAPSLKVSFSTLLKGRKAALYTGTLTFSRDKSLKLEFRDGIEGCRAGYTWSKENGGSTWVTPASFRGYNDTLTARHPHFLVDLIEGKTDPKEWNAEVASTKVKGQAVWALFDKEGTTFTVNAKTHRILSFSGPELYDEERICTTTFKEGNLLRTADGR